MNKNGINKTLRTCLWAVALIMVLAIGSFSSAMIVRADSTLDVSAYKGDRAKEDWLVPEEDGKIFAGWYEDAEFTKVYKSTTGSAYAKFVDEDVLTVKKQLKANTTNQDATTNIRFLTAIDTLMFKGVTFDVKVPDSNKAWTKTETVAYSSMLVDGETEPKYAGDVFGTEDAKFFVAHSFKNIPNASFGHTFTVTPSWETMDGTIVEGKVLNFTINSELLAGSVFADKVLIGERTEISAVRDWDISQIKSSTVTGTNLSDSQALWFGETGKAAMVQMTVTRKDTSATANRESQPLAAIGVSDGVNYGHVGVRAGGVIYNGNWITGKIGKDVLATWSNEKDLSIELAIGYKNGTFHVYVDGVFATSIPVANVISGATADTPLAFSLVMSSFNKNAQFEFSNIKFVTEEDSMFADMLTVNSKNVLSNVTDWAYDGANKKATGTHTTNSVFYMAPLYFKKTGSTMLLQTTITNTNPVTGQPFAGLYITDGTNKGGFGVFSNTIKYGQWHDQQAATLQYGVLSQWVPEHLSAKLEVALKNGEFHIYVDDLFITKLAVNSVMFSKTSSGDLAFGLTMRSEKAATTRLEFNNINFTTDATAVDAFLASKQ